MMAEIKIRIPTLPTVCMLVHAPPRRWPEWGGSIQHSPGAELSPIGNVVKFQCVYNWMFTFRQCDNNHYYAITSKTIRPNTLTAYLSTWQKRRLLNKSK